uniref:Nuclear receptor domain-containing protein n=1 Tax=Panagrolaimus davidi TaxID=227884 RepID=A0A914Q562_9BILA
MINCEICLKPLSEKSCGTNFCIECIEIYQQMSQNEYLNLICKNSNNCLNEPSSKGSECQKCHLEKCVKAPDSLSSSENTQLSSMQRFIFNDL